MDFERNTEQREKKKEEQNRERESQNVRGGGCVVKKCKFLQSL